MRSNRKGQVSGLGYSIIALVIAGVFLIMGLVMLQSLSDADITSNTVGPLTVNNETLTTVNQLGDALSKATLREVDCTVVRIVNNTGNIVLSAGNYTETACSIYATVASEFNNTAWNVTYTYTYLTGEAWDSANETLTGLGTFSDFWPIIVLAVVISIVIGLLLIVFGRRNR